MVSKTKSSRKTMPCPRHKVTIGSHTGFSLGPLPWDEELLITAYFNEFTKATSAVEEHPGFIIQDDLDSLGFSLRLFKRAAYDFFQAVRDFKKEERAGELFFKKNDTRFATLEFNIVKSLYVYSSTLMSVVCHVRRIAQRYDTTSFSKQTTQFSTDERHRFIQDLRNCLEHVRLIKPNWQITHSIGEDNKIRFLLDHRHLSSFENWTPFALAYIERHKEGIDVVQTIRGHITQFFRHQNSFLLWLNKHTLECRSDYLRYSHYLKALGTKSHWNMVLTQIVIPNKINVYDHLHMYLTLEELEGVRKLPHKSKEQVDAIISHMDEYNACDEKLRAIVYAAFNVT